MKIKCSIKFLKVCSFIFFVFSISNLVIAQSLLGTVSEAGTGESIPFAKVVVKLVNSIVQSTATDFDGNFEISPLTPGIYTVEVNFIGFETYIQDSLDINGKESFFIELIPSLGINNYEEIIQITPCVFDPLLLHSTGRIYYSKDIAKMPIMR